MNTYKNIFRACNGTRIAQCSLLIALAFLCLAIVFMCVSYNLNALATNNIAYAEEPEEDTRGYNSATGILADNLLTNSYSTDWTYNVTGGSLYTETLVWEDDYWQCKLKAYSLVNNVLTRGTNAQTGANASAYGYLYFYCKDPTIFNARPVNDYFTFAIGNDYLNSSLSNWKIGVYSGGSLTESSASTSNSSLITYSKSFAGVTFASTDTMYWYIAINGSGMHLNTRWFQVSNGSSFSGYVKKDYWNYGYDQGYTDGQNAGGGSSTPIADYSLISSTGIVRDNFVDNNDWSNVDYNLSVSSDSRDEIVRSQARSVDLTRASQEQLYTGTNFNAYINSFNGASGSLVDNTLSCTTGTLNLWYSVISRSTPLLSNSTYTLTFGISHIIGNGFDNEAGYLGVYVNGSAVELSDDFTESSGAYITLTFTLSDLSNAQLNQVGFCISVYDGCSVDIGWVKLEENASFSGYVPKSYSLYGYNDASDIAYQEGYQAGYDNAKLESFNRIGTLFEVDNYSSVSEYYPLGTDKVLVSYVAETDSFTFNGTTYRFSYFDTQGDDSLVDGRGVYNGYVLEYSFQYKIRVNTLFYGAWNRLGFKLLVIREDNHNDYFFVTREDTSYITYLSTWTGTDFGDVQQVQIDIPLQGSYYYQLAFVPINWNYHDINAQTRELRAESYQDTSTFLIWDNTEIFGLTDNSAYQNIVEQRIDDAWSEGHYDGLQEGKSIGYSNGYNVGYNAGVDATGDYTFYSLLGAVFDTPISTLRGLLNFNILGVNLYDFVIALLSLAIVLFVFRIFVRGL